MGEDLCDIDNTFPCLWVRRLEERNKAGMEKVFYYYRMKNISIIKLAYDIYNTELYVVVDAVVRNWLEGLQTAK